MPARQLRPRPSEKPRPDATTNLSDPDSRVVLARHGRIQGYNAQWACTAQQIIVATQVTQAGNDVEQLAPMLDATRITLAAAGIVDDVQAPVADAGYWRAANVDGTIPHAPELFISVAKHGRRGKARPAGKPAIDKTLHLAEAMDQAVHPARQEDARDRLTRIEPLFGQAKEDRYARRFTRRGLAAAQAEWQLIAATSNLRSSTEPPPDLVETLGSGSWLARWRLPRLKSRPLWLAVHTTFGTLQFLCG